MRQHYVRLRNEGDTPITVSELSPLYPTASDLRADPGERRGFWVLDHEGQTLGYVLRTMPDSAGIIGYRSWSDTLVAFDPALHVIGVRLRESQDTREHVEDIQTDRSYLKTWNGKSWEEVAGTTPKEAGIEGVSGASMTSMAMAEGIMRRLATAEAELKRPPAPVRWNWHEAGVVIVIVAAGVLAWFGTHGRKWLRRGFQVLVIGYVGFLTGDLLAQSLIAGWAQNGAPWRGAPGLTLMLAAALAVPWVTGQPLYCQHLCPHGAAQELAYTWAPKRWRLVIPKAVAAKLRWIPPLLIGVVVLTAMLRLPLELSHLEPFDAYVLTAASVTTVTLALVGLGASLFIPMAYCHYGCPTGAVLNFIRSHGRADRFGRSDIVALLLLGLAVVLAWEYHPLHAWLVRF
jgi:hypothetical protein